MVNWMNILALGVIGAGLSVLILSRRASATPTQPTQPTQPQLLLSGTYKGYGNIYSPEIVGNKMYFSGWHNDQDYPFDAIYQTDLYNIKNVKRLLQFNDIQLADPSIIGNKMFFTYSPDPTDQTKQKIAVSTYNGTIWSNPEMVIEKAWLPSAVNVAGNTFIYYTDASIGSVKLFRATLAGNVVIDTKLTTFLSKPDFYPVNVCVQYYEPYYVLLGDYWYNGIYSIGMWVSIDGVNFIEYEKNPIIMPSGDNIIARTPFFIKEGNLLKIWYAQQKTDWWMNSIYYVEVIT